jgi:ABC-type polysaccharide/polyol phosphate export permease
VDTVAITKAQYTTRRPNGPQTCDYRAVANARFFLLRELVRRDVESRYVGSVLGVLWPLLQPLAQLGLFSIVFGLIVRIPLVGEGTDSFPLFLFAGLVPWLGCQEAISRGTSALLENASLVSRMKVPAHILVWSRVLSALVQQAVATVVLLAIALLRGGVHLEALPHLAVAVLAAVALAAGLASGLAAFAVVFRDLGQILPIALSAAFYLTPIVYPMALVPPQLSWALDWNPLAAVVAAHRAAFLGSPVPAFGWILAAAALGAVVLVLGTLVLNRLARVVVDEL